MNSNYGSTVLELGKLVIAMTGNNDGDEVSALRRPRGEFGLCLPNRQATTSSKCEDFGPSIHTINGGCEESAPRQAKHEISQRASDLCVCV